MTSGKGEVVVGGGEHERLAVGQKHNVFCLFHKKYCLIWLHMGRGGWVRGAGYWTAS
jgi:hypothetical protein